MKELEKQKCAKYRRIPQQIVANANLLLFVIASNALALTIFFFWCVVADGKKNRSCMFFFASCSSLIDLALP